MIQTNNGKSPENALTPSKLNYLARNTIERELGSLWLTGEVTDLYLAPSGHAYFAIKDQQSSIKCTFFKQFNLKKIKLKNGDDILALGKATLYEERGTFQLKVERVETSGIGEMAKAFAELKLKLETMGYFSLENKKKLPTNISSVAIITSKSSAAIKDVLNVIKRRNPLLKVQIYHASVQGDKSVEEIIDALLTADINQHDVILLTRGGGSEEDLWTFNDISIAQTLFNLSTPCVSAIGHERDTSISDLVADISAITPTAAAELLTPDLTEIKLKFSHNLTLIKKFMVNKLNSHSQQLDIAFHKLEKSHPKNQIEKEKQFLKNKFNLLKHTVKQHIQTSDNILSHKKKYLQHYNFDINNKKSQIAFLKNNIKSLAFILYEKKHSHLQQLTQNLNTLSPLATLSRGYSITLMQKNQSILSDSNQIKLGDKIRTQLASGKVTSKIIEIN